MQVTGNLQPVFGHCLCRYGIFEQVWLIIMLSGINHNFKHNELSSMKVYTWISLYMYNARFELSFIFVSAEFGYRFA